MKIVLRKIDHRFVTLLVASNLFMELSYILVVSQLVAALKKLKNVLDAPGIVFIGKTSSSSSFRLRFLIESGSTSSKTSRVYFTSVLSENERHFLSCASTLL